MDISRMELVIAKLLVSSPYWWATHAFLKLFFSFCEVLLAPECSLAAVCWLWGQHWLNETLPSAQLLPLHYHNMPGKLLGDVLWAVSLDWLGLKWPKKRRKCEILNLKLPLKAVDPETAASPILVWVEGHNFFEKIRLFFHIIELFWF